LHLNHYFFSQLVVELKPVLVGSFLLEAFSQEKDEMILGFAKEGEDLYIKCQLGAGFQSLTFLDEFHRARKNSVDLFRPALELQVENVHVTQNDRSFAIDLEKGGQLLFKMHGSKSNVILFQKDKGIEQFHKHYHDIDSLPFSFAKETVFSIPNLVESGFDFKTQLPALGKEPLKWLDKQGFQNANEEAKIELVCALLETLHHPKEYYILDEDGKAVLSFFKGEKVLSSCASAIEASNTLLKLHYSFSVKNKLVDSQSKALLEKRRKLISYLDASKKRYDEVTNTNIFEESANILMANLHTIPPRSESIVLFDFYQNKEREIKLKKDLSPQKNAENYYRKSKNLSVEIANLKKTIEAKEIELASLELSIQKLESGETLLKTESKTISAKQEVQVPYKRFEFEGFEIRVGKSSEKNDELIQQHASKNDLWLHARGYAGSHVIIKVQAGKPTPQSVIEKAATLAAWYSKGKNDSLCPVIITEKKFVRKAKGMAPGQVIVEKERTLMVTPAEF